MSRRTQSPLYFASLVAVSLAVLVLRVLSPDSTDETGRNPASLDLSHLTGTEFLQAAKIKIIEGLAIQLRDRSHFVTAGHFTATEGSICNSYPQVEFVFSADDSVVSGEPILMKVAGECSASGDSPQIDALEIPFGKIMQERSGDIVFKSGDRTRTEVRFQNSSEEWPKSWSLQEVHFSGSQGSIRIDDREIYSFRRSSVKLRWPH